VSCKCTRWAALASGKVVFAKRSSGRCMGAAGQRTGRWGWQRYGAGRTDAGRMQGNITLREAIGVQTLVRRVGRGLGIPGSRRGSRVSGRGRGSAACHGRRCQGPGQRPRHRWCRAAIWGVRRGQGRGRACAPLHRRHRRQRGLRGRQPLTYRAASGRRWEQPLLQRQHEHSHWRLALLHALRWRCRRGGQRCCYRGPPQRGWTAGHPLRCGRQCGFRCCRPRRESH
jgi:hypothetical protein